MLSMTDTDIYEILDEWEWIGEMLMKDCNEHSTAGKKIYIGQNTEIAVMNRESFCIRDSSLNQQVTLTSAEMLKWMEHLVTVSYYI